MSGVNRRHKKTDHKVGFFRILVPEGDWESIGFVQCLLGFATG